MHYFTWATKDTTLYEASASMNTGLDSVLEIRKDMNPSGTVIELSRPIIQFDLTDISGSIVDGTITSNVSAYATGNIVRYVGSAISTTELYVAVSDTFIEIA